MVLVSYDFVREGIFIFLSVTLTILLVVLYKKTRKKYFKDFERWQVIAIMITVALSVSWVLSSVISYGILMRAEYNEEVVCNRPYIRVGTSCCLDENDNMICDKDEEQTEENNIDLTKIDVSFERDYTFNLYLNGDGGPESQTGYVTVKNNNDNQIKVKLVCIDDSFMESDYIGCSGSDINWYDNTGYIDSHTSQTLRFFVYTAVIAEDGGQSKPGTYTGRIAVKLYDEDDSQSDINGDIVKGRTIAETPIKINVFCAAGCCDSGRYNKKDCK